MMSPLEFRCSSTFNFVSHSKAKNPFPTLGVTETGLSKSSGRSPRRFLDGYSSCIEHRETQPLTRDITII